MEEQIISTKIEREFDFEKAKLASKMIDEIKESGVFDQGKSSTEIIREWRDKRR